MACSAASRTADGTFVEYSYDSSHRLIGVEDEKHTSDPTDPPPNTRYTYSPGGLLERVPQKLSTATPPDVVRSYSYDARGNLTEVTDPNGNITSSLFNDFDKLVQTTSAVTGTTTYEYDSAGLLIKTTDANGAATTRTYDDLNRILSATSSRTGVATEVVNWTYDECAPSRFGLGRLTRMSDPAGSTSYFYQRQGLLRREERTFSGVTEAYVTSFHYDRNGNRSRVEYPSGMAVTYAFDFADRPASAVSSGTNFVTSAAYLPFGPPTMLAFGNGTTQLLSYDNRYRLSQNKLVAGPTPLAQYDYAYDASGNITQIRDGLDLGYDRNFAYDDLNRLVTANTGLKLWRTGSYSYDAMGNMLSLKLGEVIAPPDGLLRSDDVQGEASTLPLGRINAFAYQGSTPLLASVTLNDLERPVTYDAAGNELSYAIGRSYSARNHMTSVTEWMEGTLHRIDYSYDGRGIRVKRSEPPAAGGSSNRYYVYSPELQLLSVTSDDAPNVWLREPGGNAILPAIRTEMVWFGGRPVAQAAPPSATLYTFTDHLGTPILQTNTSAAIVWHAEYEPFGNVYEMRTGNRTDQPLRFPGQEVAMALEGQEESYNIFRWYRAGWGRYTQADPLGRRGEKHPYAYGRQNPLKYIDPRGTKCTRSCPDCPKGVWLVYGADVGFTAVLGSLGYGASMGVFEAKCLSSSKTCTFFAICSKLFGAGAWAGIEGNVGLSINAPCADDIAGIEWGVEGDIGKGPAGGFSASIDPGANVDVKLSGGLGIGASATVTLCDVKLITCRR